MSSKLETFFWKSEVNVDGMKAAVSASGPSLWEELCGSNVAIRLVSVRDHMIRAVIQLDEYCHDRG